ncbi:hypothetical protein BURMUCF2_B0009 [Burkholderia multivorans CF2]|nr:hypothetical protein BURMUCGD1_5939 [Burkholderia multivorans CGD1]EJO62766.1 hypothetical protein BURMUCF2_B0009 [Burkholderia multivorans CF2]
MHGCGACAHRSRVSSDTSPAGFARLLAAHRILSDWTGFRRSKLPKQCLS